ncbi:FecR family protein [Acinetobacter sp. WZC-1]|uniref:FecR family protein n=1 Tax=Acinetobacter sp. WZC-1 TaxID=3459034 RepID=UPI00403DD68B
MQQDEATILEQAADWLLLMEENPLDEAQQAAFEQWKNSSAQHQRVWKRAEKIRQKLQQHSRQVPPSMARNILSQPSLFNPFAGNLVIVLACGTVVAAMTAYIVHQQAWLADYRTPYGQQKNIELEDGTHISLNSKTAIDVQYTATQRNIILRSGEIYIETGKDHRHRPFRVLSQDGSMLALGTAFNVQQQQGHTIVTVTEHAVQVTTAQTQQQQMLQAGDMLMFTPRHFHPVQKMQFEQLLWRKGMVTVNRMSIAEFARIIERNYGVQVKIDPQFKPSALDQIEISGTYPINHLDRMINLLEDTYPIRIKKTFFNNLLIENNI